MRAGRKTEQVLMDEKHREDVIRGVTGWRPIRWGSEHIRDLDVFARRLQSFGIRPPG